MGFHLRKTLNAGGIRFNLSNSGIGFSVGKGIHVGIDGKGRTYVGGGKGILRYRKYYTSSKNQEFENLNSNNKNPFGNALSNLIVLSLCSVFILPIYFLTFISLFFKSNVFSTFLILSVIVIVVSFLIVKNFKKYRISEIIKKYNNNQYETVLPLLLNLKDLTDEENDYITRIIYDCYAQLSKYEEALDFIEQNNNIINFEYKKLRCLYCLEKWTSLIAYMQQECQDIEKNDPCLYYALLGEAFIQNKQPEIALETMLQGPTRKRKMDYDMCIYRYALGECYEANNSFKNALKQYQKIYAYDVEFKDICNLTPRVRYD